MTIKTGRDDDYTTLVIDTYKCDRCGLCAKVCNSGVLKFEGSAITISHGKTFGCTGCVQCAAICPHQCIFLKGRRINEASIVAVPEKAKPSFESLYSLALSRRSVREFKDKEVPAEILEKIINFTSTAPVQIPPSNVELLVFSGREKIQEFSNDVVEAMIKSQWRFSPFFRKLLKPFMTSQEYEAINTFTLPLISSMAEKKALGEDGLTGSAPLAIYFYSVGFADPVDCQIAATYAMLAGEALGLGTCIVGAVAPFVRFNRLLRKKYGIPDKYIPGVLVLFGYPAINYQRAIKRQLGDVRYFQ